MDARTCTKECCSSCSGQRTAASSYCDQCVSASPCSLGIATNKTQQLRLRRDLCKDILSQDACLLLDSLYRLLDSRYEPINAQENMVQAESNARCSTNRHIQFHPRCASETTTLHLSFRSRQNDQPSRRKSASKSSTIEWYSRSCEHIIKPYSPLPIV